MFTGLVQAVGTVRRAEVRAQGMRLGVDVGRWEYAKKVRAGDSVCVAGVCLTVVKRTGSVLEFDLVLETLEKSRLRNLKVGDGVNLEHAATASTFMGGHIVQGHVDGVGRVTRILRGENWQVWVSMPQTRLERDRIKALNGGRGITVPSSQQPKPPEEDLWNFLVPQGSVCVEGVSLTIAGLWEGTTDPARKDLPGERNRGRGFRVALIPTTLRETTLGGLMEGHMVNLEMDVIAKMVARQVDLRMGERARPAVSRAKKK
jgi:riboflavin synthase